MTTPRRTTPPALRVLSWGGGLDSTTLALMSEHGDLPRLDAIIFADTMWEPQEVYETLEWALAALTIPVYRISMGDLGANILDALNTKGVGHVGQAPFFVRNDPNKEYATADSGGRLWRKCTSDYKIRPIRRKVRELLGVCPTGPLPQGVWVEQWIGFPVDDLGRTFCSDVKWIINRFPLIEQRMWKRDCMRWLTDHGYPIPPKSSCVFCPFHSNAHWRRMRDTQPEEWAKTVAFDAALRQGKLPGVRGDAYLHRSMLPLPMAPIDAPDIGQSTMCFACNT